LGAFPGEAVAATFLFMPAGFKRGEVLSARKRQESAYDLLLRCFESPVFNIVSRLVDHPSDAARAVERVFRKAFRAAGAFRGEDQLRPWIYRLAVTEARRERRWSNRLRRRKITAGAELQAVIEVALRTIKPELRVLVVLREVEGLSYEEISTILAMSVDTVKSRASLARDALQRFGSGQHDRTGW